MLPPDFFTISSSTIDWRQMLIMIAWNHSRYQSNVEFSTHFSPLTPPSYLLTGDGDPLKTVFAHQILESQLQFDLTFGWAAGVGGAVG